MTKVIKSSTLHLSPKDELLMPSMDGLSGVVDKTEDELKNNVKQNLMHHDSQSHEEDVKDMVLNSEINNLRKMVDDLLVENKLLKDTIATFESYQETEAFQRGFAKGEEEALLIAKQSQAKLETLIEQLDQKIKSQTDENSSLAIELTLAALCKLLNDDIQDIALIKSAVEHVLPNVKGNYKTTIGVSASLVDAVREVLRGWEVSSEINVIADARVEYGGCVIENEFGCWDARLDQQVEALKKALKSARD